MMFAHALAVAAFLAPAPFETAAEAVAKQILTDGSKLIDAKDSRALSETYTPDGEILLYAPEPAGGLKVDKRQGRADIEAAYRELFGNSTPHSRNEVEFARFAGPDILVIHGRFTFDTTSSNADAWPFVQIRVKQGEKWLLKNLQLFLVKE